MSMAHLTPGRYLVADFFGNPFRCNVAYLHASHEESKCFLRVAAVSAFGHPSMDVDILIMSSNVGCLLFTVLKNSKKNSK